MEIAKTDSAHQGMRILSQGAEGVSSIQVYNFLESIYRLPLWHVMCHKREIPEEV